MLIQVPSDLGSLNLKNHTDQNVNEVCIFRDIVFVILFPIQVLCFEIVTLKAKQAIPFSISTSPRFPPFSALFSLLFSASFALKHDTEGIQGLSFHGSLILPSCMKSLQLSPTGVPSPLSVYSRMCLLLCGQYSVSSISI